MSEKPISPLRRRMIEIGYILRDPLLPFEILAEAQLSTLVKAIDEYQTRSRKIWDKIMSDG
jgi:hypothetical protein